MIYTKRFQMFGRALCFIAMATFICNDVAADLTWNGSTDGTWSDFSNWTPGAGETAAPGTGDTAVFDSAGNSNTTLDLGAGVTLSHLLFDGAGTSSYTIGSGAIGSQTLSLDGAGPNSDGIRVEGNVVNDQTINSNLVLVGAGQQYRITNASNSATLIINGSIDAAGSGVQTLGFGNFSAGTREVTVNGDITVSSASRNVISVFGQTLNINGDVIGGGNTQRTLIRDGGIVNVGASGSIGQGAMTIASGTLNLNNTTTAQLLENGVFLGSTTLGDSDAAINIASGGTVNLASNITYFADDTTANAATISGGTLQITGSAKTFIANNNSTGALADSANAELTITSTITNDGSDRDLTIRNTGGGTLLIAPTLENNTFGAITMQEGVLQLGNGALDTGGDFLNISARDAGATAANTVATVDIMGSTNTVNDINIGNDSTANITTNGFQANLIDSVGGGKLVDANLLRYRNGTGTGVQRNGAAVVSADIDFDSSGTSKIITIEDGTAVNDLTISSALNTIVAGHDFNFIGDGTLSYSGTLGLNGVVGAHDRVDFNNQKTVLDAAGSVAGQGILFVRQRNSATYSDFEVELDINGQTLNLQDDLVIGAFTDTSVVSHQSVRVTDSLGSGTISLDTNTAQVKYNRGNTQGGGGLNVTGFIEADILFNGGNRTFSIDDGASDIDLEVSGTITDDNGGGRNLFKSGAGTLKLSATDNAYNVLQISAGRVVVTNVGALGDNDIQLGNNAGSGVLEFDLAADAVVANDNQIRIGDDSSSSPAGKIGAGSVVNNGAGAVSFTNANFNELRNNATAARTLTLSGTNTGDNTIAGTIRDNGTGGSVVSLTKDGTGKWILNGDNTYTGDTALNAGQLDINGTNVSNISVASGATLGGEGSTTGTLTLVDGAIISGVDGTTAGALTASGGMDLSGATAGGITVNLATGGPGVFTVLDYNGTATGFTAGVDGETFFTIGSAPAASGRGAIGFADTGTAITYDLGYGTRTWDNTGATSLWTNGNTDDNWVEGDQDFFDGDSVLFDDTPGASQVITLGSDVNPTSIDFNNTTAVDYTINDNGGGESITGSTSISKTGNGNVFLNNANTFTGGTTIAAGDLSIGNVGALGTGDVLLDGTDAELSFHGTASGVVANNITMTNTGNSKFFDFNLDGVGTIELSGNIGLDDTNGTFRHIVELGDDNVTMSGQISGVSGLDVREAGVLLLNNDANSFGTSANGTSINVRNDATLQVTSIANAGVASAAGVGSEFRLGNNNDDGTLEYVGASNSSTDRQVRIGGINNTLGTGGAIIENNGAGTLQFSNAAFNVLNVNNNAARTLTLGGSNTGANEIQGAIIDNDTDSAISLVKADAGTWTLSGSNTYTGTTAVNAGTLVVNGSTSTGDFSVAAGARLEGTGTIGGATTISGTHGPGDSLGIQNFTSSLTYEAGANIEWELIADADDDNGAAGVDFDQINLAGGTLDFEGSTSLDLDFSTGVDFGSAFWMADQQWTVFGGAGSVANFGNLSFTGGGGVPTGGAFFLSMDSNNVFLNYTFSAVPEPGTLALFGLGIGMIGIRRRRKRTPRTKSA